MDQVFTREQTAGDDLCDKALEHVRAELGHWVGVRIREEFYKHSKPIPMILWCPHCNGRHIDAPDEEHGWTNPPHRSHKCGHCGYVWRPADVATEGVQYISTTGTADVLDFRAPVQHHAV